MMNRQTGRALDPASDAHLEQSINDVLSTPIATRAMVRAYGAIHPDLVDQPSNPLTRIRLYAATALALQRWEPRVRLSAVRLVAGATGIAALRLSLFRRDQPRRGLFDLVIPLPTA